MSLARAQISPENTAELKNQIKSAVLDWIKERVEGVSDKVHFIRSAEALAPASGIAAYELFVAPAGSLFRKTLTEVCAEAAGQLDIRIDLEEYGTQPGVSSLRQTQLTERLGRDTAPGMTVALLQNAEGSFAQISDFVSKKDNTMVIRKHEAMSQEVASEMFEIEHSRARPIERQIKASNLHADILGGLRVLGVEMSEMHDQHPFVILSQQDPLLGALYLSARSQELVDNPPIQQAWAQRNLSDINQEQLKAVVYSGEYRMLGETMARRAVRGQQNAIALVEGLSPQEALSKCGRQAEDLGLFRAVVAKLGKVDRILAEGEPGDAHSVSDAMTKLAYYYKDLSRSVKSPGS